MHEHKVERDNSSAGSVFSACDAFMNLPLHTDQTHPVVNKQTAAHHQDLISLSLLAHSFSVLIASLCKHPLLLFLHVSPLFTPQSHQLSFLFTCNSTSVVTSPLIPPLNHLLHSHIATLLFLLSLFPFLLLSSSSSVSPPVLLLLLLFLPLSPLFPLLLLFSTLFCLLTSLLYSCTHQVKL